MSGIYIKGMEMPKAGGWKTIRIYYEGTCAVPNWQGDCTFMKGCEAIPVPDHGDLIDRDETLKKLSPEQIKNVKPDMTWEEIYELNVLDIVTMPTIVPADKEGEE